MFGPVGYRPHTEQHISLRDALLADTQATATIVDDRQPITLSVQDVTVPSVANGDVALNVTQSGKAITQKLFLTVHD